MLTLGQAQVWYGPAYGVIWECYLHEGGRGLTKWEEVLAAFWQTVERDLAVDTVFTEPHEPDFAGDFRAFLEPLGYAPDPRFERWWRKPHMPAGAEDDMMS